MSLTNGLLLLALLLALSAFFSMSEIALASSRRYRLQTMLDEGDSRAATVLALQDRPGDFFTVCQIGLNAVAIMGGIVGDDLFSPGVSAWLQGLGLAAEPAKTVAVVVSFLLTTSLYIQFADLLPKQLAMLSAEGVAVRIAGPMQRLARALQPVVFVFDGITRAVFRLAGIPTVRDETLTSADIVALADAGAEAGTLQKKEHHLIENVFGLDCRTVGSAMTPRDQVVFVSREETDVEIRAKLIAHPHSRYPLCESGIDSVFAWIDAKDLLQLVLKETPSALALHKNLSELAGTNLLLVPDTLSLSDLLDRFRETREDFAVILNEYALVVGIITLYDVMNQLVDGIVSDDAQGLIVPRDANSWLVDGMTPVEDLKRLLEVETFPGEEGYETVAGFLMHRLKRIPRRAESVEYEGFKFEVLDIDHHKIDQVLISRQEKNAGAVQ